MSCAVWCYMILGYITISINAFYTAARVLGNWGIPIQWVTFLQNTGASPSTWVQVASTTLPETNIAPENRPSQKASRIPTIRFQVLLLMEEILHQLIWRNYHYLQGFIHLRWCRISSINRMLVLGSVSHLVLKSFVSCRLQLKFFDTSATRFQTKHRHCPAVLLWPFPMLPLATFMLLSPVASLWVSQFWRFGCADAWWWNVQMIGETGLWW